MALPTLKNPRSFGEIFGTGIGQGINQLTQQKLAEMSQHKRATALQRLGVPSNLSSLVSQYPDELQYKFLDQMGFPGMLGEGTAPLGVPGGGSSKFRENLALKQQGHINKSLENYFKMNETTEPVSQEIYDITQRALELLNSGKVASGLIGGKYNPRSHTALQNAETQEFLKQINRLVVLQGSKGIPSRARLLLEQASKPVLEHKTEVQRNILDQLQTFAKRSLAEAGAIKEIQGKYGYNLPQNARELIKHRKEQLFKLNDLRVGGQIDLNTPAPEGTVIQDDKGKKYERIQNQWVRI